MLQKDITRGACYVITHHGERNIVVEVLCEKSHQNYGSRTLRPSPRTTRYVCRKLSTGRMIEVKSAQKFQYQCDRAGNRVTS
jgi:hypothetical protein